ncbi:LLM class flavin-dependent oxidoreductase [Moheibacter sp.]|uniref:LLM class flavin-dependent oxidoreductase n=1 Tax=Moheibacter sp. TaxID=1965316 RepID=UPI003C727E7A
MELGIGMFGDLTFDRQTQKFQPAKQKLNEIIEQVKLADELGIDVISMGEHHREDYAVSSPEIILSALATVTKRIKLGSGVTVLSSTDPVKVYQDFATVDLISDQRVEIMAGRGSFIESFPLFGYDLKDYNSLFEEKLELLVHLNQNEVINWEGNHRAPIVDQTIYPRPERELPIWIAVGGTPESVVRAARLGLPIIFAIIGGMPKQFKPLIEFYKQQYIQFGHDPEKMQIGVHSHTFLADSQQELLENYFPYYKAQMDRIGKDRGWAPYTQMQFEGGMSPEGALFMGETNQVIDKMIATIEMFGLTRFIAHIDVGGPTHKEMMKAIELYGSKVLPEVRKVIN